MNRIELLFETWSELNDQAEMAIFAYDAGEREEGMVQFERIWQVFQKTFSAEEDRADLEEAYQDTMNMVLNRMYLNMEESGEDEKLWVFCTQVCRLFKPGEIWREEYAVCIGRMLQKRKDYEACDLWFEGCGKAEPDNPVYAAHWAACFMERGMEKRAEELLDHAVAKTQVCNYLTLGFYRLARKLYEKLNRKEKAELCRQRICDLDEDLLFFEEED